MTVLRIPTVRCTDQEGIRLLLAASLTGRKPVETKKTSLADKIPFLKR